MGQCLFHGSSNSLRRAVGPSGEAGHDSDTPNRTLICRHPREFTDMDLRARPYRRRVRGDTRRQRAVGSRAAPRSGSCFFGSAASLRTRVCVDGFNLYYGALKGTPYKWLDLVDLARRLFPADSKRLRLRGSPYRAGVLSSPLSSRNGRSGAAPPNLGSKTERNQAQAASGGPLP